MKIQHQTTKHMNIRYSTKPSVLEVKSYFVNCSALHNNKNNTNPAQLKTFLPFLSNFSDDDNDDDDLDNEIVQAWTILSARL